MKGTADIYETLDRFYKQSTDPIMSKLVPYYLMRKDNEVFAVSGFIRIGCSVVSTIEKEFDVVNIKYFDIPKIENFLTERRNKENLSSISFEDRYKELIETLEILKSYEKTN